MDSAFLLPPGVAEGDYASLESFAAHIQEVVLHLRDEGHLLSSVDQHYIERWWEAGYPLESVLAAVLVGGRRLMARKRKPRGLPLKSLDARVRRDGAKALERAVGTAPSAEVEEFAFELRTDGAPLPSGVPEAVVVEARRAARTALAALQDRPPGARYTASLSISRAYYDALLAGAPLLADALRAEAEASLGDAARRMTPEGLAETVEELARRRLKQQDPSLDPATWDTAS